MERKGERAGGRGVETGKRERRKRGDRGNIDKWERRREINIWGGEVERERRGRKSVGGEEQT